MTETKRNQYKHWRIEVLDANDETVDVDYVPTKKEAMKWSIVCSRMRIYGR